MTIIQGGHIIEGASKLAYLHAGPPADGPTGTLAAAADKGDLLIDTTNAALYMNAGTKASPVWTELGAGGGGGSIAPIQVDGTAVGIGAAPNIGTALLYAPTPADSETAPWNTAKFVTNGDRETVGGGTALVAQDTGTSNNGQGIAASTVGGTAVGAHAGIGVALSVSQGAALVDGSPHSLVEVIRSVTGTGDVADALMMVNDISSNSGAKGDLFQCQANSALVFKIAADGTAMLTAPAAAPADAFLANGSISLYLDEGGGNLKAKIKLANGTIKTATLAFDA